MRTINQFVLLIMGVLLVTSVQAQSPDHQYNFSGQVKWMMLHESGTLIASTGETLIGIRPNSNDVSFMFDRPKRVKEENLEEKLGMVLDGLKLLMEKRKNRIERLRSEIERIEVDNKNLEDTVSSLLRDF